MAEISCCQQPAFYENIVGDMLTVLDNGDCIIRERIAVLDPFQLATLPLREVWNKLPCETVSTVTAAEIKKRDEDKLMAIRQVLETEAPIRLHRRSGISSSKEFDEVLTALRSTPKDKALVVTLESKELLSGEVKKPEVTLANTLRRYFMKNGIMATAYQSAKNEVTIRHASAAPKTRPRGKK
jgi:hypothetical protein